MEIANKIFAVQEEFKKKERRKKFLQIVLNFIALIGLMPTFCSTITGFFADITFKWWICAIGLIISFLTLLVRKYFWLETL